MPAYSTPPPGVPADMWKQVQDAYATAEQDPEWRAAQAQKGAENNAYRAAQTASMGMLTGTPQFSSGVADPAAAFERFSKSGYSGADALRDGWLTGVGTPGWQQAGANVAMTGMYGGGTATPDAPRAPATSMTAPQPPSGPTPSRATPATPAQPAMKAMYGAPKQPSQPATPATPAHWEMGDSGAAGAWSNGYNPQWVGETQPPPSATTTQQPGQATQPGQAQQPSSTPAQPGGGRRGFGAAPRWGGGQPGGGRRRFGNSAMGNMYGGG